MNPYFQLLRPQQWYKNLVVVLALLFSGNLFHAPSVLLALQTLGIFILLSSAGYIINDFVDKRKDILHPDKKMRPLAAGKISLFGAFALAAVLFVGGIFWSLSLGKTLFFIVIGVVILQFLYTFFLKNILFADILAIASLFVVRAIAGAVAIDVRISPWLILCPFFLSLFLSVGKRHADVHFLKEKASATREVLSGYTSEVTHSLMIISTTLLAVSYALYSFLSEHQDLLFTLPLALFTIFRFYYLISTGSEVGRQPEKAFRDVPMVIGMVVWVVVTVAVVYG